MNGKHILIGFLAVLVTIILVVGFGVLAVAFGLKNPEAFSVLASAITGLVAVAIQFRPGRDRSE